MTKLEDAKQQLKCLENEFKELKVKALKMRDEIRDLKEWIEYLESIE